MSGCNGLGSGEVVRKARVLFALPGLHRVSRGAEVVFENIGARLDAYGFETWLVGSGPHQPGRAYCYARGRAVAREHFGRWPSIPPMRTAYSWEDLTFAPSLFGVVRRLQPDITVTCNYPFCNWVCRAAQPSGARHVFVTQNGDWPLRTSRAEYRFFGCDALVCTNAVYHQQHADRFSSALIPNGVDVARFGPGPADRSRLGAGEDGPIVLIVAALIPSKRVAAGLRAAARIHGVRVIVCGDGTLRREVEALGRELLGDRFCRMSFQPADMPDVYRAADVLLHMSKDEPFGNIYVEAMATGLPVVAHDWRATRWIMGQYGELVDTDHEEEVVGALERVLDARVLDAGRAKAIASGPCEVVRRFSWDVVAGAYAEFFRRVLALPSQARGVPA